MLVDCSVGSFNQLQLWIQYNWNLFPDCQSHAEAKRSLTQKCNEFKGADFPILHLMGTRNITRFPPVQKFRKLPEVTREDPYLVVVVFKAILRLADIKSSISFSLTCGYMNSYCCTLWPFQTRNRFLGHWNTHITSCDRKIQVQGVCKASQRQYRFFIFFLYAVFGVWWNW